MNIIQKIKEDKLLSGYYTYTSTGKEKWVPGWLEICDFTDDDVQEMYNQMKKDIKELKEKYKGEIIELERMYPRWEVELYLKWKAAKIKNNCLVVNSDKEITNFKKTEYIPFTFYLLEKMLRLYEDSLRFAKQKEQEEINNFIESL